MSLDTKSPNDISTFPVSPLITIPAAVLQDLLGTLQELKDEVAALREERAQDHREMATLTARMDTLTARVSSLESMEEQDISRVCLDIAQDRQRIARLERPPEPQPTQKDRAEILRALLAANNGKMLAKEARKKMHLSEATFSQLLNTCSFIERKALHSDRRKRIIILKSELL
jgi:septal ring factor EnvC (AmiA/AmiB activator)